MTFKHSFPSLERPTTVQQVGGGHSNIGALQEMGNCYFIINS